MKFRHVLLTSFAAGALALGACTHDGGPSQSELDAAEAAQKAAEEKAAEEKAAREKAEKEAAEAEEAKKAEEEARKAEEEARKAEEEARKAEEEARKAAEAKEEERRQADAKVLFEVLGTTDDGGALTAPTALSPGTDKNVRIKNAPILKELNIEDNSIDGYEGLVLDSQGDATVQPIQAKKYDHDNDASTPSVLIIANGVIPNAGATADDGGLGNFPALIASPDFARGSGSKDHEIPDNQAYIEFDGTFDGAEGTYRCSGPSGITCTSTVNADGGFTLTAPANAAWAFVPDAGAMTSTPDDNYLVWGWWKHTADNDEVTAGVFATSGGSTILAAAPVPAADNNNLHGKATYKGEAVGLYALDSPLGGGSPEGGAFRAAAMLEADFNDDSATDVGGTVTGTLDNFMTDNGAENWSVALLAANISSAASGAPDTGTIGGTTSADAPATTQWTIDGRTAKADVGWNGGFYDAAEDTTFDGTPLEAVGTFTATFNNAGHMLGAFGVRHEAQ